MATRVRNQMLSDTGKTHLTLIKSKAPEIEIEGGEGEKGTAIQ